MKIKALNQDTINKIAAGEVILRPASVVKELVENSLDAGSTKVTVSILEGGKKEIKIIDDGCGINYDEIPLAFRRHATSKINYLSDLETLETMGFRGEALSSVAAVADVNIITRADDEEIGSYSEFRDGVLTHRRVIPYEKGTEIIVSDLFSSIPARYKFLKKENTEERKIRDIVQKLALAYPTVSFEYLVDNKRKFQTNGNGNLLDTARIIFGNEYASHLHEFTVENLPMKVSGLIGDLDARRNYRDNQIFFINGRFVKSSLLSKAFEEEWLGKLMKHQYPSGIIFIDLPPKMLDINVHPQKTEIRILNKSLVEILFKQSIRQALEEISIIPETVPETVEEYEIRQEEEQIRKNNIIPEPKPEQQSFSETEFSVLNKKEIIDKNGLETSTLQINSVEHEVIPKAQDFIPEKPPFSIIEEKIPPVDSKLIQNEKLIPEKTVSEPLTNFENHNQIDLNNLKYIGHAFNTYLILEDGRELYYIDQHAAHEAVLYEAFRTGLIDGRKFESQQKLIPEEVYITNSEVESYENIKDKLRDFGFETKRSGNRVIVSATPMILNHVQPSELIIPLIAYFDRKVDEPDYGLSKIITMSCKKAVKGGDDLTETEIRDLLNHLFRLENPYTCPHGRPIIRKQSKHELEKLFKRIV